jgi:hypothetical protein
MTWSSRSISAPEGSDPAFNVLNPNVGENDQSPRNQVCAYSSTPRPTACGAIPIIQHQRTIACLIRATN